ncbi:hypothetical protein GCM10022393_42950 [Aquimarina addita]|uniref:Uncharacterized protein n=1 Tax=Aquimarina addita TaxID=870485 RepID=A0ABP6UYC4_9FLAO
MTQEIIVKIKIPIVPNIIKFSHIPTWWISEANIFNKGSDEKIRIIVKMINDNK